MHHSLTGSNIVFETIFEVMMFMPTAFSVSCLHQFFGVFSLLRGWNESTHTLAENLLIPLHQKKFPLLDLPPIKGWFALRNINFHVITQKLNKNFIIICSHCSCTIFYFIFMRFAHTRNANFDFYRRSIFTECLFLAFEKIQMIKINPRQIATKVKIWVIILTTLGYCWNCHSYFWSYDLLDKFLPSAL